jgi:hypothetical protein
MHTMRKLKLLLPALLFPTLCATAQDEELGEALTAKPIQYTCTYTLPEAKDLFSGGKIRFFNDRGTGCEITYVITDGNLMDIDKESLEITSVTTEDGKDITAFALGARSRNHAYANAIQYHNFSYSPFGTDQKEYTTFSFFVATETPLIIPKVKGFATAKVAKSAEFANLTFKTDEKGQEQAVGTLTFSVAEDRGGDFGGNRFGITLKGNMSLIKSMSLSAGGKTLRSAGHSSSNDQGTYYFSPVPTTPEVILSITYYTDIQDIPIILGQ